MKHRIILFFLSLFSYALGVAQPVAVPPSRTTSINALVQYVKSNCSTPYDRLLTIQRWMSQNIVYDVNLVNADLLRPQKVPTSYEYAMFAFKNKRGVCAHFSSLFALLANKMDIKMLQVDGVANGQPHGWCAAVINGQPYLFDPTWTSGGLVDGKYEKGMTMRFFMAHPDSLKFSHIPVDPLFQFSEHPLKFDQAAKRIPANEKDNPYFNWRDTLTTYLAHDSVTRLTSSYQRAIHNGKPDVFNDARIKTMKDNILVYERNRMVTVFNAEVDRCNKMKAEIVNAHNRIAKAKGLTPAGVANISNSLKRLEDELDESVRQLNSINTTDKEFAVQISNMKKNIELVRKRIKQCYSDLEAKQ